MMKDALLKKIQKTLKGKIKIDEPLKNHTTIKIGGPARLWIQPQDLNDLNNLYEISEQLNLPIFVIGSGSNLIVRDEGINGICVKLDSRYFNEVEFNGSSIKAASGVSLNRLTKLALDNGLSGLEFLVGIPGTVGGALIINAGAWNKSVSDLVEKITVSNSARNVRTLDKRDANFSYRKSDLDRFVILETVFKLKMQAKEKIKAAMDKFLKEKRTTQELRYPSAGCIFKNPSDTGQTAGVLIEKSGLKGRRIGDAMVSTRHANFIINAGNATAKDVLALIGVMQNKVKKDHNIWLEPEVKIV